MTFTFTTVLFAEFGFLGFILKFFKTMPFIKGDFFLYCMSDENVLSLLKAIIQAQETGLEEKKEKILK